MKNKKHNDKLRYKTKIKKKQMDAIQEEERIRSESFDKLEQALKNEGC